MVDPPRHRHVRKLIFEWFRPQRIDSLEREVREAAIDIINAVVGGANAIWWWMSRLETRIMLEEILRGLPGLQLAGEIDRLHALVVSVIKRMPVRFSPFQAV